jgi:hypothetical protein
MTPLHTENLTGSQKSVPSREFGFSRETPCQYLKVALAGHFGFRSTAFPDHGNLSIKPFPCSYLYLFVSNHDLYTF